MKTLRIMTWNVHGIFHLNPKFDVEGVCSVIRHWSPDIAALQEVDSRGRKDDPFALLAEAIAGHSVDARTIVTEDGDYGQVLLSRWPFAAPPKISDVSYREREPRRAIAARILADQGEVTVILGRNGVGKTTLIATHLGLSIHERHAQAHALAELVQPTRTLVLGDFNDWFWVKSVRGVLARICPVRTRLRTFPSHLPMMRQGHALNCWSWASPPMCRPSFVKTKNWRRRKRPLSCSMERYGTSGASLV